MHTQDCIFHHRLNKCVLLPNAMQPLNSFTRKSLNSPKSFKNASQRDLKMQPKDSKCGECQKLVITQLVENSGQMIVICPRPGERQ